MSREHRFIVYLDQSLRLNSGVLCIFLVWIANADGCIMEGGLSSVRLHRDLLFHVDVSDSFHLQSTLPSGRRSLPQAVEWDPWVHIK